MIILDTNVLSELMRATPARGVLTSLARFPAARLHVTSITVAEVMTGLALMPLGRRRSSLEKAAQEMFDEEFSGRTVPFDDLAAHRYAAIVAQRTKSGRPIATLDAQIAAIAFGRGATLATRNGADFLDCGVEIFDPWA